MEKKSIGEYISALRKVNGLTQKELAEKLNVTDKAVSRWENGDSLPDLSQIPVMAEIFGVSCDEILSGETKQAESKSTDSQNARAEKRIKKLLKDAKADFQNKTLISEGVIALGFLCVLLCNFAFLKAGLGFLLGCGFYIASVICQCCFSGGGKNKIDEEEMACEYKELSLFILNKNQKYTCIAICAFALSLPCAFLLGNINAGLEFGMLLLASLASLIVALLVNITIVDSIFHNKAIKEELIDKNSVDARKTQAKLSVRKTVVVIFVIISVLTTGIYVMFMEMNREFFAEPKTFSATQLDEFVEYMQTPESRCYSDYSPPTPAPKQVVGDLDETDGIILSEYKNADGEYISLEVLEMYYKKEIKDSDDNIILTYYALNENVSGHTISWLNGNLTTIEVYTYDMYNDMHANRQIAIFTLLCVYAVISVGLLITAIAIEKKKVSQIS